MRRRKRSLTIFLLAGAALLVAAVFFGNRMGDRVISQVGAKIDLQPTTIPSVGPSAPDPSDPKDERRVFWKKSQVVTAATDPAFPDPRVTPPPTATPRPATPVPTARPKPTDTPYLPTPEITPAPTVLLTPVPPPPSGSVPSAANESAAPNPSLTP
jgi:hypothetical protein